MVCAAPLRKPLIITQRGKSAAVLVDVQEFEAMQEKIELLSDIQSSLSQLEKGDGISHSDAKNTAQSDIKMKIPDIAEGLYLP